MSWGKMTRDGQQEGDAVLAQSVRWRMRYYPRRALYLLMMTWYRMVKVGSRLGVVFYVALAVLVAVVASGSPNAFGVASLVLLVLATVVRTVIVLSREKPGDELANIGSSRNERSQSVAATQRRRGLAERAAQRIQPSATEIRRPRLTLIAELAGVLSLLVSVVALALEFL